MFGHWGRNRHANSHILFIKNPDIESKIRELRFRYSSGYPKIEIQALSLFRTNYIIDIYDLIPRLFTITTKNDISHKFNVNLLKDTSSTIEELLNKNPEQIEYQLDVIDERDVLGKFEEMYRGKSVTFSEEDLPIAKEITGNLNIVHCPNCLKSEFMRTAESNSKHGLSSGIGLSIDHSSDFFKKIEFSKTFTIETKHKEYQCNIFGVLSSKVIREFILNNPKADKFVYEYEDNFDEFQLICDIFNFKQVEISVDNMDSLKENIDDLQITYLSDKINDYVNQYEKISETIDDQQASIDLIEKLFDLLYNIKKYTVEVVKESIIDSIWSKTEENVQELAAFILQVIRSDFIYHPYLIELLIQLDKESNESNNLDILMPFMIKKLFFFFGESNLNCSFVYNLYKKGIISICQINELIYKAISDNSKNKKKDFSYTSYMKNMDEETINVEITSVYSWFLPEIINISKFDKESLLRYGSAFTSFINMYYPNNLEDYKIMRDSGEPADQVTKALKYDDVDTLQSIVSMNGFQSQVKSVQQRPYLSSYLSNNKNNDFSKFTVPYNIYEDFIINGSTKYIDYAAAYGSIKCFKYLLLNHAELNEDTFKLAVYGGNIEIIKIVDQKSNDISKKSSYLINSYSKKTPKDYPSILKHQNDLFDWILQEKYTKNNLSNVEKENLLKSAAENGNAHSIISIIDKGNDYMSMLKELIQITAKKGFYHLAQILYNLIPITNENDNKNTIYSITRSFYLSYPFVSFGNLALFKLFSQENKKPDEYERALELSVKRDYKSIIDYYFEFAAENNFKSEMNTVYNCLNISISKTDKNKTFKYLLQKFKQNNPTVFEEFKYFEQLLSKACFLENFDLSNIITQLILENKRDEDFTIPFFNAALSGSFEICKFLIDQKVFINYEKLSNQVSKLSVIDEKIFSLIVENADNESKTVFLNCYLEQAIQKNNKGLIKYLLKNNSKSDDALFYAISKHDIELVDIILEYNKDPSFVNFKTNKGTALYIAVKNNDLPIVQRLLSIPGIDPNLYVSENQTPLLKAISNLNIEITNEILKFYGDDIITQKWQLNEGLKMALDLISNKTDLSKCSSNPSWGYKTTPKPPNLQERNSILAIIKRLLETGCLDYNLLSGDYTILSYACEINDIEIVQILLKSNKVNVNLYSPSSGDTPLITAIEKKNIEIAKILIQYPETNINMRNYQSKTALTIACENNLGEIIDLLIKNENFNSDEIRLNQAFYLSDAETSKHLISAKNLDVNYKSPITNTKHKDYLLHNHEKDYKSEYIKPEEISEFKTTLIEAVSNNNTEKVDLIIQHPSFDKDKSMLKKALFSSIDNNGTEIFKKLLKLIDNVNIYGINNEPLLKIAVKKGNKEIVSEILQTPSFDSKKSDIFTSFTEAYTNQTDEAIPIMEELYKYDSNHEKVIDFGNLLPNGKSFYTSIGSSREENEEDKPYIRRQRKKDKSFLENISQITNFFLQHDADPNKPDKDDFYPLEYAILLNSVEFVRALLDSNKVDLNTKIPVKTKYFSILNEQYDDQLDEDEATYKSYLHLAARSKKTEILAEFLNRKLIDINIQDDVGNTPLFEACYFNKTNNIIELFKHDDLNYAHKNNDGNDALEICASIFSIKIEGQPETKSDYLTRFIAYMAEGEEDNSDEEDYEYHHAGPYYIDDSDDDYINDDDDDDYTDDDFY